MKNFLYVSLLFLLFSCYNQGKPKKPANLISTDKMVSIIVDMAIYSSAKGVNKKVLENNGVKLQEHIYEKHQIDSAQFANSNNYYTYHVEEYEAIYNKVRDSLTKLKEKYNKIKIIEEKEKKERDSIKRIQSKDSISKKVLEQAIKPSLSTRNRTSN